MKISVTALAFVACALAQVSVAAEPAPYSLVAVISKDGAEVDRLPLIQGGAVVVFDSEEACKEYMTLPFYPLIHESLEAYVAKEYGPDAKADESCVPVEQ